MMLFLLDSLKFVSESCLNLQ